MVVSCVFKRLQEEDDNESKEEIKAMNKLDNDEELMQDPVLKLGKTNYIVL